MNLFKLKFIPLEKLLKNPGVFAETGDLIGLQSIISQTPNAIHYQDEGGNLLHIAASHGKTEICEYLIDKGINVDSEESELGGTPLMLAAAYNYLETVKLLLKKGADIDKQDRDGVNALHIATSRVLTDMVKLLVDKGASRNVKDKLGRTPLDVAKTMKLNQIAEILK